MPRALVLDDDPVRHAEFSRMLHGLHVDHAWSASQAADYLRNRPRYNVVFLDHDLNKSQVADPGNGCDVASFIATMEPRKLPELVYVHSWNERRSRLMAKILRQAGVPTKVERFHI